MAMKSKAKSGAKSVATRKLKLDARTIRKLPAPPNRGERWLYYDDGPIPMFGVGVARSTSGRERRFFFVRYKTLRGVSRLMKLGPISRAFGLSAAREAAGKARRAAKDGHDPVADGRAGRARARKAAFTVEALADAFVARGTSIKSRRRGRPWARRTRHEFERILLVYVVPALGALEANALGTDRIERLLREVNGRAPTMANRVRAVLHLMYRWGLRDPEVREFLTTMPVFPDALTDDQRRERVLTEDEVRSLWRGTEVTRSGDAFRLMLLTAQRASEVLGMRWADLTDEEDGTWWLNTAKGGKQLRVPLSKQAAAVLATVKRTRSPFVFPSRTVPAQPVTSYAKVWAKLGLDDATPHDLRRTAASLMARTGVRDEIIKRVLGHALHGVTEATYIQHSYDQQKREGLAKLGEVIDHILTREARVVSIIR
jgi:integrase